MRGDIGTTMGLHVHIYMFLPSRHLSLLVILLERVSGSSAALELPPTKRDMVAHSVCGGWQVNLNNRLRDKASAFELAEDIATQHDKHAQTPKLNGKAFGVSRAIGRAAQESFYAA